MPGPKEEEKKKEEPLPIYGRVPGPSDRVAFSYRILLHGREYITFVFEEEIEESRALQRLNDAMEQLMSAAVESIGPVAPLLA